MVTRRSIRASAPWSSASSPSRSPRTSRSPPTPSGAAGGPAARPPAGRLHRALTAAQERAGAHAERHSLWLHNSLRGAVGLGLAVLVADLTSVQHGFWVVFGTLSVLRSSALSTGQNIVRALARDGARLRRRRCAGRGDRDEHRGAVGAAARRGPAGRAGAGDDLVRRRPGRVHADAADPVQPPRRRPVGRWAWSGSRTSRSAAPSAWSSGSCLWPRGAAAALGRALSRRYADSARYLAGAVAYGLGRCDAGRRRAAEPADEAHGPRPPPAGSTTPSAATWPSGAPSRCRWPR